MPEDKLTNEILDDFRVNQSAFTMELVLQRREPKSNTYGGREHTLNL